MNLQQKRLHEWFRRHGWRTSTGTCFGQAYLCKNDFYVEISPVQFGEMIYISDKAMIALEEMEKIVELARRNCEALDDYRYQREKRERKEK